MINDLDIFVSSSYNTYTQKKTKETDLEKSFGSVPVAGITTHKPMRMERE